MHDDVVQCALISGVLGRGTVGVFVTLAATSTAAVTVLWVSGRYAQTGAGDPLTLVLIVIAALQLVLLPMQYRIFFLRAATAGSKAQFLSLTWHQPHQR